MEKGGFGLLMGLEILESLQVRYGIPSAQEEDNVLARFELPMNRDDPLEAMMLHLEEIQIFFLAHLDGNCRYTDIQLICQSVKNL